MDSVTIGLDSESMVTVDYTEGQYTVSLNCSYVGQSVTFNGMFISNDCRYDVSIGPAEIGKLTIHTVMHSPIIDLCAYSTGGQL